MDLSSKKIVITGGNGLIGKSFVKACLHSQAKVIIADINEADGIKNNEAFIAAGVNKDNIYFEILDITSQTSIQNLLQKHKDIDALVNNAYPRNANYGKALEMVTYADFCENTNMHLGGYFLCMQQFAEYFKQKGSGNIINMSSIYGVVPPKFDIYENASFSMPVEYAAIKSALIHLTKYFAKYYAKSNIRFNCISPGGIYNNHDAQFVDAYAKYALNKGMLDKEDITGTLLFLLSDYSKNINGQNIIVDDGWSL
jgi:NAD(P)-dependent dehydrogenase (short-subunit alcohol dehydrogenase family)